MWKRKKLEDNSNNNINWQEIYSVAEFEEVLKETRTRSLFVFKHSRRCSISTVAFSRVQNIEHNSDAKYVMLDVVASRPLSNFIEEHLGVVHASPQLIVLKNGKVESVETHLSISSQMLTG